MLTPKQHELFMFIHARLNETGIPPSFDEMKDSLDLKSKSGIHRLITALEERGYIRRLRHRARALEVLKLPENMSDQPASADIGAAPTAKSGTGGFTPSVIEGGVRGASAAVPIAAEVESFSVPVMGRIAAGVPISAIQDHTTDLAVPPDMISGGEHFALEVNGDSMIEAGIHDGDLAVIRKCDTAQTGDIVVALVDDEEATLKTLRKKGESVALEAANPAYETRIFGPDRVRVQGRLVGIIRKYS